jgi:hypothetical protein
VPGAQASDQMSMINKVKAAKRIKTASADRIREGD